MSYDLFIVFLLMMKHTIIDYVFQTEQQIKYKGVYGDGRGISHSIEHGIGTILILFVLNIKMIWVPIMFGIIDAFVHYHLDYIKVKFFGHYKPTEKRYWCAFGTDQLYHFLTYVLIAYAYVSI